MLIVFVFVLFSCLELIFYLLFSVYFLLIFFFVCRKRSDLVSKLENMRNIITKRLPYLFEGRFTFEVFASNIVFRDSIVGVKTTGLPSFKVRRIGGEKNDKEMIPKEYTIKYLLNIFSPLNIYICQALVYGIKYSGPSFYKNMKVDILKITTYNHDNSIRVRWRITGTPRIFIRTKKVNKYSENIEKFIFLIFYLFFLKNHFFYLF